LQTTYKEDFPDVKAVKERIADLESALAATQEKLTQYNAYMAQAQKRLAELQSQLNSSGRTLASERELLKQRLDLSQALQRTVELRYLLSKPTLSNWTVKAIEVEGLSASAREALLAGLPVKVEVGGKLAEGSVNAIATAVKTCCRRALACPMYRHRRKPQRRIACACVPSTPARAAYCNRNSSVVCRRRAACNASCCLRVCSPMMRGSVFDRVHCGRNGHGVQSLRANRASKTTPFLG